MTIRMAIVLIITLFTTRIVLRALGVVDYGIYNVVAGFVTMFSLVNNAMMSATQRFFNFELGKAGIHGANNVYNTALLIHFILAVITIAVTEMAGVWYMKSQMVIPANREIAAMIVFQCSVISLFFTIMSVPFTSAITAHERMNVYAVIGIMDAILKLGVSYFLLTVADNRLPLYAALFLAISIFDFILYATYSRVKFEEIRVTRHFDKGLFKRMFSFSSWGLLGSLAYMMRDQGVNLVLNSFFGPIVNAAKGVASQVDGAICNFSNNIVVPSRPQVIQSYATGNVTRALNLTYSISKLACLAYFSLALPIILEISYILNLWLGNDIPQHTAAFVVIILITNTFGALVSPVSTIISATGKVRYYQIISGLSNIMSVPLALIFISIYEIPELAFTALFITMATNLLSGLYALSRLIVFSWSFYFSSVILPVLKVFVISIPISFIPYLIFQDTFYRLLIVGLVSVITICISSYFFALNSSEKEMVKSILSKFCIRCG